MRIGNKLYVYGLSALMLAFYSCVPKISQPKIVNCPVPQQNCSPSEWKGTIMDTTDASALLTGFKYVIEPVKSINTVDDEWALSFIDDGSSALTYSKDKLQSILILKREGVKNFSVESGLLLNMPGHYGSLSVSGNSAFFAVQNLTIPKDIAPEDTGDGTRLEPSANVVGKSRLYSAEYAGKTLKNYKQMLPENPDDPNLWQSQPASARGGNIVFFASDAPGGKGGTDLWMTWKKSDGEWSEPMNCGETINSECDELTPFVSKDSKKIFFSSCGFDNVGGYDLFYSLISQELWQDIASGKPNPSGKLYFSRPFNLRAPINTPDDEIFPSSPVDADSLLYYSSNQNKQQSLVSRSGGFDIYVKHRKYLHKDEPNIKKQAEPEIDYDLTHKEAESRLDIDPWFKAEGNVYTKNGKLPVVGAEVKAVGLPEKNVLTIDTTKFDGSYELKLPKNIDLVISASSGDLFYDQAGLKIQMADTNKKVHIDFYLPEQFVIRINFPTDEYKNPYPNVFDSLGVETKRSWESDIEDLAENIKNSSGKLEKIVLVGHTDDVASQEYNLALGKRRVEFVINELIKRGVPKRILEGRSAGKSEPLSQYPGEDIETFRKRLRRVTLEKILKKTP